MSYVFEHLTLGTPSYWVYQTQFKGLQLRGLHHFLLMGNQPGDLRSVDLVFFSLSLLYFKNLPSVFFLILTCWQNIFRLLSDGNTALSPLLYTLYLGVFILLLLFYKCINMQLWGSASLCAGHQANYTLSCWGQHPSDLEQICCSQPIYSINRMLFSTQCIPTC